MLHDLFLEYKNGRRSDIALKKIIGEASTLINGMLQRHSIPWQVKEEIRENCRSYILYKAIKTYKMNKAKFQTYLYYYFKREIDSQIRNSMCQKRPNLHKQVLLDDIIVNKNHTKKEVRDLEFKDILVYMNRRLNGVAKETLGCLLNGTNKYQTFNGLHIGSGSTRNKIIAKIKKVYLEAVNVH